MLFALRNLKCENKTRQFHQGISHKRFSVENIKQFHEAILGKISLPSPIKITEPYMLSNLKFNQQLRPIFWLTINAEN